MNQIHRILFISFLIFIFEEYSNSASVKQRPVNFQFKCKDFFIDTEDKKNWVDANQYCKSKGLKLASITSQEEGDAIARHLQFINATGYFWTSGNDIGITNHYIWESTGEPFNYTNWHESQPDHYVNPNTGVGEQCVSLATDNTWYDDFCHLALQVICNN